MNIRVESDKMFRTLFILFGLLYCIGPAVLVEQSRASVFRRDPNKLISSSSASISTFDSPDDDDDDDYRRRKSKHFEEDDEDDVSTRDGDGDDDEQPKQQVQGEWSEQKDANNIINKRLQRVEKFLKHKKIRTIKAKRFVTYYDTAGYYYRVLVKTTHKNQGDTCDIVEIQEVGQNPLIGVFRDVDVSCEDSVPREEDPIRLFEGRVF